MKRITTAQGWAILCIVAGCSSQAPPETSGVPASQPDANRSVTSEVRGEHGPAAEISYETDRDRRFAEFVRETVGPMVKAVAVGLEKKNTLKLELGEATKPEDTLPLTKSLMVGARKDFPDQPIALSVYDPSGSRILTAHYQPGEDVRYELARGGHSGEPAPRPSAPSPIPTEERGVSAKDRKFAQWAMDHGRDYLRYVEPDLERSGRLWFGVTRKVKPDDVRELTSSLLEGASKEFPDRELTASVFDPEGEQIGNATRDLRGRVHWAR